MDSDNSHKQMDAKVSKNKLGDIPVSKIMKQKPICLRPNYSIKGTIETFRTHHISGAPVIDEEGKIIGIVSEYDLLIQAAAKTLNSSIDYNKKVFFIKQTTNLKDVLILLYKNKFKRIPVVDDHERVVGSVSRIDVLAYIAENEPSI